MCDYVISIEIKHKLDEHEVDKFVEMLLTQDMYSAKIVYKL